MVFINFLALKVITGFIVLVLLIALATVAIFKVLYLLQCGPGFSCCCGLETYSLLYSTMIIIYNNILHPLYHHIIHDLFIYVQRYFCAF